MSIPDTPTIINPGPVPDRDMDDVEFDNTANSFLGRLPQFSDDLQASLEWTAAVYGAMSDAYAGVEQYAQTVETKAAEADKSADAARRDADRAQNAVLLIPEGSIDDAVTGGESTWSSDKINRINESQDERQQALREDLESLQQSQAEIAQAEVGQVILSSPTAKFDHFVNAVGGSILRDAYPDFRNWLEKNPDQLFLDYTIGVSSIPTSQAMRAIVHADGLYVTVGSAEEVFTSADGLDWTLRSPSGSSTSYTLSDVIHGNGLFVAIGDGGHAFTSSDGINWNRSLISATRYSLLGIAYGNGLYVAVGVGGKILTSANGTSWSLRSAPTTNNLNSVVYGGGLFIAVGANGIIIVSENGVEWSLVDSSLASSLFAIRRWNGKYLATSSGGLCISTDGLTWEYAAIPNLGGNINDIVFMEGVYLLVGNFGGVYKSTDLKYWGGKPGGSNKSSAVVVDGQCIAVGSSGSVYAIKEDKEVFTLPDVSVSNLIGKIKVKA